MKKEATWIVILSIFFISLVGCGTTKKDDTTQEVKIGIMGYAQEDWAYVQEKLAEEGINISFVSFSDYAQPNAALADGQIDLNAFQHQFFLDNYNEEHGTKLVSIGNTANAPLGIYSEKIKDIKELTEGAQVAIPNDVTNGGRALKLLQTAGLIEVDSSKGPAPTVSDITKNPKNLKIIEVDATQTIRSLQDVAIALVNSGIASDAGYQPTEDAIYLEPVDEAARPYVNIVAAREVDKDNEVYQKIVVTYQTNETKKIIEKISNGATFPAWETFGRK